MVPNSPKMKHFDVSRFVFFILSLWGSLLLTLSDMCAQDMSPSMTISGSIFPGRSLKDTTGTYARQRIHFGLTIPILKKVKLKDEEIRFLRLSFHANASIDNIQLSLLSSDRTFLIGNTSINSIYRSSGKSMWLSRLTVSSFEDETTIHNPSLRVSGFALYKRSVREAFFYMVGGAYSFTYGIGVPLPVLGVGCRFNNRASLTAVLPFNITYRFGKVNNQFALFFHPNGGISNFANTIYPAAGETIVFRRREFALGIKKRFRVSDQWSFMAEAGMTTGRKIFFSRGLSRESSSVLFESKVHTGPYISLGVRFRFKKSDPVLKEGVDQIDIDSILQSL